MFSISFLVLVFVFVVWWIILFVFVLIVVLLRVDFVVRLMVFVKVWEDMIFN